MAFTVGILGRGIPPVILMIESGGQPDDGDQTLLGAGVQEILPALRLEVV
jgi:hypothetical protein